MKPMQCHKRQFTFFQKPTLNDPESYQKFFLQEVQLGEELLAKGVFVIIYVKVLFLVMDVGFWG